jgi:hypothetical protein
MRRGETAFHAIRKRLVDRVDSIPLARILELLGGRGIPGRIEINIAGSIPTRIKGRIARPTDDIEPVAEVPEAILRQRDVPRRIEVDVGLAFGYVPPRDPPPNWRARRRWFGDFGGLRVDPLDEYDLSVSPLSSEEAKHRSDLDVLALELGKE